MTEKELVAYFDTINIAKKAIGVKKENRKKLMRLEKLKELLLSAYDGMMNSEFEKETGVEELYRLLEKNKEIKAVWDRDNPCLCRIPGRTERNFDVALIRRKNTEAPDVENFESLHDKSFQQNSMITCL